MAASGAIRRRIKSVKNTRKITKAMELVAASKMRRSVQVVLGTRPYARLAWDTVRAVSRVADASLHPLLRAPDAKCILLLLLSSDRGLAGGFNANIVKKALVAARERWAGMEVTAIVVGKRGGDAVRRAGIPVLASFSDLANAPSFFDIQPIARLVRDEFSTGTYARVTVAYTHFVSAMTQQPILLDLLPFPNPGDSDLPGVAGLERAGGAGVPSDPGEYLFEPRPEEVLDRLLPRLVDAMTYQALLESSASEHSARMLAMRSASDAATDMVDSLTFAYNQMRQAGITREIAEISSGKAALET
ncbi:ATP synthase F1 subunit gamma [Candidatus Uhrbacteria bacterium]|nr:ATP synthase F1 subunit gamma [Candidatus Uhrbacteria bacterium]